MRRFVEDVDSISARDVGKALPRHLEIGRVKLEISGIGTQELDVVSTPGRYGGFLRWFACPGCGRRVAKLYLPTGKYAFLCRHCYKLSYRAQFIRRFRKTASTKVNRQRGDSDDMLRRLRKILENMDKREELMKKLLEEAGL